MDLHHKLWNDNHQKLNQLLAKGGRDDSIALFLDQHAMVHSAEVFKSKLWSFEDELLADLSEPEMRQVPPVAEHSIAWTLLHLSRIEDIVMNMLIAGTDQIFTRDNWARRLNVAILHSANKMDDRSMTELNARVDLKCLLQYRARVARRTRQIVRKLHAEDFKKKVDKTRIENVIKEQAVTPEAVEMAADIRLRLAF